MYNPFSLEGKTILVVGASSGIGRETAVICSKMGGNIILSSRNEQELKSTYCQLDISYGQKHEIVACDLSTDEGIFFLSQNCKEIDGLVFSSGINDKFLLKSVSRDKIAKQFNINIFAPMLLLKEMLKAKKIRKGSSIVLISSIAATYATISNSIYASTKGAMNSFVRVQALELASKKIRVNAIMPGMVNTKMIDAYSLDEEALKQVTKTYPLGRLGEPEDISNAIVYFLSDASSWITGTNLVVDGGVTLR